ncbi:hypothetical protein, partial [Aliarcobacter butzleri]|uniref:hypothetical protein n=1 Tax=Aliarcobacter butzleri TaxID=28197 RepID=UPI0021B3F7AA
YDKVKVDEGNKTVTSTITDNPANKDTENPTKPTEPNGYGEEDTVYVVISENVSVKEGEDLVHNLKLVDKEGKEIKVPDGETVTVTLKYVSTTGTIDNSDFTNTRLVTITLDSNGKATITNSSKIDAIVEGSETYTVSIDKITQSKGVFENIESGYSDSYKNANPSVGDGKSATGTIVDNEVRIVLVAVDDPSITTVAQL